MHNSNLANFQVHPQPPSKQHEEEAKTSTLWFTQEAIFAEKIDFFLLYAQVLLMEKVWKWHEKFRKASEFVINFDGFSNTQISEISKFSVLISVEN